MKLTKEQVKHIAEFHNRYANDNSEDATHSALTQISPEADRIKKAYEEAKVINEQLRKRCGMLEQDWVKAQEGLRCMMEKNDQSEELKEEIGLLKDLIIKLLLEARGIKA